MIFLLATLFNRLAIILLLVRPYVGFLLVLAAKPLIDMTWGQNISGVNLLKVIGVAMPLLLLPRLLASSYWQYPTHRPWYLLGMMFFPKSNHFRFSLYVSGFSICIRSSFSNIKYSFSIFDDPCFCDIRETV